MKMLIIVYNDTVDETIITAFKEAQMKGYTKWKETLGEGDETEPKLGTHYWPEEIMSSPCSGERGGPCLIL